MEYTVDNFYTATYAVFTECDKPNREPDYVSYRRYRCPYTDELITTKNISSEYWYEGDYVYRRSNHWGSVASCYWDINSHVTREEKIIEMRDELYDDLIVYIVEVCKYSIDLEGLNNIVNKFNQRVVGWAFHVYEDLEFNECYMNDVSLDIGFRTTLENGYDPVITGKCKLSDFDRVSK